MLAATLSLGLLAASFGLLLGYAAKRFRVEGNPLVETIDHALPQTQCGQCGYPGCHPYAEAIVAGEADINLCVPGGEKAMLAISEIMGVEPKAPVAEAKGPHIAFIDENLCIGCTLCTQACPVDAIVGAAKQLHTILMNECTGCELCVEPCPVECIHMVPVKEDLKHWRMPPPGAQKHPYPVVPILKVQA